MNIVENDIVGIMLIISQISSEQASGWETN